MSTDALFGPDGTQPPEPPPVLPDPLVGTPTGADDFDSVPPLALPQAPDLTALREAVRSALGEDVPPRPVPPAPPPRPRPAHQAADLRTPPSGIPVQRPPQAPAQPAPALPRRPMPPPASASGRPTTAKYPARAAPPAGQPPSPAGQRAPSQPHRPLAPTQRRRSSSIGCIVALIFFAIVLLSIVSSIVDAITGG